MDELPFAMAVLRASDGEGRGRIVSQCNASFSALLGQDACGMDLSVLLGSCTADKQYLLRDILRKVETDVTEFICGIGGKQYVIRLRRMEDRCIICIVDSAFGGAENQDRLERAVNTLPAGVVLASCRDGRVLFMNPAAQRLTGWGMEVLGRHVFGVLPLYQKDSLEPLDIRSMWQTLKLSGSSHSCAILNDKNGGSVSVSVDTTCITSLNGEMNAIILLSDTGALQKYEKEIAYLSFHDKLTGLYNRDFFEKKIKEYDQACYYPVSIILGDANGLKMTNDIFGHAQGDVVLTMIANILSLACRESDIVARYGGDEFIVLMPNTPVDEAAKICKHILQLCASHTGDKNGVSISLGYASKQSISEDISCTINVAENFMYRNKLLESRSYRSSVISSLKKMLFEKSFETEEHAMRLTGLCAQAGRILGLSQSELNDLELFSMLHDIGKIGVKDQILLKPSRLTENEWIEMRKHSEIGYRIAQSAPELSHIADYILYHHEHYNGSGYPQGLKGEQIPLLSRILAVADTYDAMVNDRYYRKAMSVESAVAELKRCAGTQFDSRIVDVFLKVLEPHPPNLSVVTPNERFA